MPRGNRTERSWDSERIGASQHVEDCPDQLRVGIVVVVRIWVVKSAHDTVLVLESDLGPQENVGQRLGGLCPDFCLKFALLLLKAGEGCVCLLVASHVVWVVVSLDLGDDFPVLEMLRRECR